MQFIQAIVVRKFRKSVLMGRLRIRHRDVTNRRHPDHLHLRDVVTQFDVLHLHDLLDRVLRQGKPDRGLHLDVLKRKVLQYDLPVRDLK